jgi:molecular chaperone DnaK (HSP70)
VVALSDPVYIIGIDLGTTNSVLAYTEIRPAAADQPAIHTFKIPQLVGPGSVGLSEVLPSFVLLPGPHDVPPNALSLPWNERATWAVGQFARDRGAEIPHRLISSAKSWLCHSGVDRNKPILPWEAPEEQKRLSPVEASADILRHIRDAWDHVMAAQDPALRMETQEVFLTVPASFDVVARNLTVQAAEMAGLPRVTLLEEPQSAFYAWIGESGDRWREQVRVGDLILVVDVGGGTTDFSLIRVSEAQGDLTLERVAVGDHLLVGGDNMDLTLAYTLSAKTGPKGGKLTAYQMRGLCQGCRNAKEQLLKEAGEDVYPLTVLGRGSGLIGGAIRTELTRKEVQEILVNGFFPACEKGAQPQAQRKVGMRELGLVYASDPAITRHLARFLAQSAPQTSSEATHTFPTAVLFNGGVMKAERLKRRLMEVLSSWGTEEDQVSLREIQSQDLDLAVARGAAYYGLARRGKGIRIKGGLSRSYYVAVETAMPAVPGLPALRKALCVAGFGMEEGTETLVGEREFGVVVGEPVVFDFLGSRSRHDTAGTVIQDWEDEIEEITTVEAVLEGEPGSVVPVSLQSRVTEVGTLELWCLSKQDDRRFKLEFNVREKNSHAGSG